MNKRQQHIKGFSIIEVVLVLAIAGLIFLMVFIALPALQSGQRDTARKNDVSAIGAAVNTFASANKGSYPNATQLGSYTQQVSTNTTSKTIAAWTTANVVVADGQVAVVTGATCGATGAVPSPAPSPKTATQQTARGSARQYVVITLLEAGGGTTFCQDF